MKVSFIGFGNMAGAMAKGLLSSEKLEKNQVWASGRDREKLKVNCQALGIHPCKDNKDGAMEADVIFIGVKPHGVKEVAKEIKSVIKPGTYILSMAVNITLDELKEWFGDDAKVVRLLPNTPVAIRAGVVLYSLPKDFSQQEASFIQDLLAGLGLAKKVEENLMASAGTLSGCGPAFVDLFLEGLADGAVHEGLPRSLAYELAAQTLIGSAGLLLSSGRHPGQLKDEVTSPGGTTIQGIRTLEALGFRSAAMEAIIAASNAKGKKS